MSQDDLVSPEHMQWLGEFEKRHGRKPRVLHIGNIANNAYVNAKILNKAGLDCDVMCYDYYHIMGCPEWEDADIEGEIKDQFSDQFLLNFKRMYKFDTRLNSTWNFEVSIVIRLVDHIIPVKLWWVCLAKNIGTAVSHKPNDQSHLRIRARLQYSDS